MLGPYVDDDFWGVGVFCLFAEVVFCGAVHNFDLGWVKILPAGFEL